MSITYDDVMNLARTIRRKIMYSAAYEVVRRALKALTPNIDAMVDMSTAIPAIFTTVLVTEAVE